MLFSDELVSDRMCITGGGEAETRAAVRIHLFTLLFEECKILCANIIEESTILVSVTRLLDVTQKKLKAYQGRAIGRRLLGLTSKRLNAKWKRFGYSESDLRCPEGPNHIVPMIKTRLKTWVQPIKVLIGVRKSSGEAAICFP